MKTQKTRPGLGLGWISFIIILLLLLAYQWWGSKLVIRYDTFTVRQGDIEASVVAIGTLYPSESVAVGAQVSGQIVQLNVSPGSIVEEGQLLAEIDPSLQQATVDAGRAQLASQRAQLIDLQAQFVLSQQQFSRQQRLALSDATSGEEVQVAIANLASAESRIAVLNANIQQTQSRLKGDEATLGYTRIYAPMSGTVLALDAELGQTLNATYSTPAVLTVADLAIMTAEVEVAEADIRFINIGMAASFTTLGNESRHWQGKVRQVLPAPIANATGNNDTVFYTVLLDVANSDGALRYGMTVQVTFVTDAAEDVLLTSLLGLEAVVGETDLYAAQVLDNAGQPQWREVVIGSKDLLMGEVLGGLVAGEKLVIRAIAEQRRDGW